MIHVGVGQYEKRDLASPASQEWPDRSGPRVETRRFPSGIDDDPAPSGRVQGDCVSLAHVEQVNLEISVPHRQQRPDHRDARRTQRDDGRAGGEAGRAGENQRRTRYRES